MTVPAQRPTSGASAETLAAQLREVRRRTHRLVEDLAPGQLMGRKLEIVNPILWEIGHIAWFHERWTLREARGEAPLREDGDRLWDSSAVPHATRWDLPLPDREGTAGYMGEVLSRELDRLGGSNLSEEVRYFYDLVIRHEDMHVEALTYMRQTLGYAPPELGDAAAEGAGALPGDAEVPGGRWRLGSAPDEGFVFDNEKWAHELSLEPFRIALAPVTNLDFAEFVADDGYAREELWSTGGWAWRSAAGARRPVYWVEQDGQYAWRRYDDVMALAPDAPVVFVNYWEAEAWCRWARRRLPSEAEWEAAAVGEPEAGGSSLSPVRRRWPWGDAAPARFRANLDFAYDAPLDVAACPAGDSAFGCRQMIGNVWEWTSSDFLPFAGFSADPYEDYSRPWFSTRKVLRGGCFASSSRIARPGYRNFFTPERRDVFAGFRSCAL